MNTRRTLLSVAAALPFVSARAVAQPAFPARTVRVFTPSPPGAGPDAALRVVTDQLARRWSQPVLVENKPGGNGFIAVSALKQGAADGHDLIQLDNSHTTTHPTTFAKLPYDVERDFAPLAMLQRTAFFVAVATQSPWRTVDDLIAAARDKPGRITYGSWFNGSPGHLGALRLASIKDLSMTHVPFKDFGQLYAAVANGDVDWALGSIASAGALERAGKLRFIARAAPTRDPQYPNVPCAADVAGIQGYEVTGWTGLFAPRAVAATVREKLAADIAESIALPEVTDKFRAIGFEAPRLTRDAFADLIRRETAAWAKEIRAANIRLD